MRDSERPPQTNVIPLWPWPLVFIMLAAFTVVAPFLWLGNPSGHDFEFHLHSWIEVLSQWRQGILYPRWAALSNHGFGEARFIFYPPLSWTLGAALGAILPWKIVPGVYIWIVLTLSGCSMFALARRWVDRSDAIFAAVLYVVNPYYILIVYWRSAFAELLAGALLPLLLLYVFRLNDEKLRAALALSLVVAAAWLSNAPAAVMVNYSLALLAIVVAIMQRSWRTLCLAALVAMIGACLAAFYILPATYEQRWVNIAQVLAPGVRPQGNFLFTWIEDPEHNIFNLLVSVIAAAEIIVLAAAWSGTRRRRIKLCWPLLAWASTATVLIFSCTYFFWAHLPFLRFLQLPWRWLLCLNVAFALLVTLGGRWLWRVSVLLLMFSVLFYGWHRLQAPWWDTAAEISKLAAQHQAATGYEGTDEYVPAGADASDVDPKAPLVTAGEGNTKVQVSSWAPESRVFTVIRQQPGLLILHLFDYPAWQVKVNGHQVETQQQEDTGQMEIPVAAGESRVEVRFTRTWDRSLGGLISLITLAVAIVLWKIRAPHRTTG